MPYNEIHLYSQSNCSDINKKLLLAIYSINITTSTLFYDLIHYDFKNSESEHKYRKKVFNEVPPFFKQIFTSVYTIDAGMFCI